MTHRNIQKLKEHGVGSGLGTVAVSVTLAVGSNSQNVWGWKGPLWVPQSKPPAEAGSLRAGCTGPCLGGS